MADDDGTSARGGSKRRSAAADRKYHHGALREALIAAAEHLLAEKGVDGFTLRECARRAGVSPAAPAHHFGDAAGLLTEVAIRGFVALRQALQEGNAHGGGDPLRRLHEQGLAYVGFATSRPGPFRLIFRKDRLDCDDPRLSEAGRAAFLELETAIRDVTGKAGTAPLDPPTFGAVLAAWSLVHGFAHLAIDGEFDRHAGPGGRQALVETMLPHVLRFMPGDGRD